MEKKALRLLVILLCLSYAAAVPATRSPMTRKVDASVQLQDNQAKEDLAVDLRNIEKLFDVKEEGLEEGRIMMDISDYPGPRANPAHDPKSPGKP